MHFFSLLMIFSLLGSRNSMAEVPFVIPSTRELGRLRTAEISKNKGSIFIELYPEDAPLHVANFKYRADKGLFSNTRFNKFTPGYVIQGGNLTHSPKRFQYKIPAEFNQKPHKRGSIGMARHEDLLNPDRSSDASQFFILLTDAPHMDGKYTSFGKIIKGFSVIDKLRAGDQIREVRVFVR